MGHRDGQGPHSEGLAIVTPRWMRHILNTTTGELHEQVVERITSFGKNVFGAATPEESIQAIHDFYESIGIPMTLGYEEDIAAILRDCL